MGLFDKKYCDICGDKIGFLGNKKLSDGNLCKNCEAKLSPWFSERRQSSVEEIAAQLEYREANREAVASFKPTRTFGEVKKLLIDEDKMLFTVCYSKNLNDANPDIIPCSDITGFYVDIDESRSEMTYKNNEGNYVSYTPAQYKYSYDWYAVISVNHPYFDEIRFKLNDNSVVIEPDITVTNTGSRGGMPPMGPQGGRPPMGPQGGQSRMGSQGGMPPMGPQGGHSQHGPQGSRGGMPQANNKNGHSQLGTQGGHPQMGNQPNNRPPVTPQGRPVHQDSIRPIGGGQTQTITASSTKVDPNTNANYCRYQSLAEEIKAYINEAREESREAPPVVQAVICPFCGATTIPDTAGCCEYCGSSVRG